MRVGVTNSYTIPKVALCLIDIDSVENVNVAPSISTLIGRRPPTLAKPIHFMDPGIQATLGRGLFRDGKDRSIRHCGPVGI